MYLWPRFSLLSTSWSSWLEFREAPRLISISFLLQQLWLHFAFDSQDMKSLCDHFRSTTISLYEGHPGEGFKTRFKDSARRHTWSFSWNAITRNSDFYNNPASPNGPHIPSIFVLWTSKIFVYFDSSCPVQRNGSVDGKCAGYFKMSTKPFLNFFVPCDSRFGFPL